MKRITHLVSIIGPLVVLLASTSDAQDSLIKSISLEHPNPATPYYHFRAQLNIPEPTMLDVEASVDGDSLRLLHIKDKDEKVDPSRPVTRYRAAFANTYAADNREYRDPIVTGWLQWQPGQEYAIEIAATTRGDLSGSEDVAPQVDTQRVKAPGQAEVFDPAWKNYKSVVLSETAGIDREAEPVDLLLAFYADESQNLANDLRVVAVDPQSHEISEVPSQAYDIHTDAVEGDPRPANDEGERRQVQMWVPTRTARVAFLADVPARSSKVYLIYHNHPDAQAPESETPLTTMDQAPGAEDVAEEEVDERRGNLLENDQLSVVLHKQSKVLYELTLKSKPQHMLFHKKETNGSIHWAPEVYSPPRPWAHTSDWQQPKFELSKGPVVVSTRARGDLPFHPEVDASVSYKLYAGQPYIRATTSMRVKEPVKVMSLRNGEVVFERSQFTHFTWYDAIAQEARTVNLAETADLDEYKFESDVPWLAFSNPETGMAFGGVQLGFTAGGLENAPRVLPSYFYVIVGPWVYWTRAVNSTFASNASQLLLEAPTGMFLWEDWAYLVYEPAEGDNPHAPLIDLQKRLTHPLRVRVTEEAESRVPTVGTEVYIDPSKTGWEGRETGKPKE